MEQNNSKLCGIILTAGLSSRMGSFKPLLPIGRKSALEHVADTVREAGISRIIAVTGYQKEQLEPLLLLKQITAVYNDRFREGMFTSIQKGIEAAGEDAEGFFLFLVDCPLIPSAVVTELLREHYSRPDCFLVPCYQGKKGHPLYIPACYREEILSYHGEGGLKAITSKYEDKLIKLEVKQEAVVLDMDTEEGYREVLDFYEKQMQRPQSFDEEDPNRWRNLLGDRRLFLVRHGETQQHREKILLGQKDIPLSGKGMEQARLAGQELQKQQIHTEHIYASDLTRTVQTAEIIADILDSRIIKVPSLREMSLGEWDGCYISEIKEKYPEEFRKRGENLLTYKYGNNSENFYDLQYRVLKGFQTILESDEQEDIIIVAHAGVIKVIVSNLYHTELEKEIREKIPNGGITMV